MHELIPHYTDRIETTATEETPPDPARTRDAFARIGYSLEEAVADLIDNSIDAGASEILVRFVYDRSRVQRVFIADNGRGMKEDTLRRAMRFGSTLPHEKTDLGKYGIGLKSASLSQCASFSVLTRGYGETSGRRWSPHSIKKNWSCETLDPEGCVRLLASPWGPLNLRKNGTIVLWEQLTCLQASDAAPETIVNNAIGSLSNHLGLAFHRFVAKNTLQIFLDAQFVGKAETGVRQLVPALDPFGYTTSGARGYPKDFTLNLDAAGKLTLQAHIWPPKSKELGYRLGGGKTSSRQGFYFYRNNRLIQAGGWNGYREDDTEPHLSLARVSVNLPPDSQDLFQVSVQKSKVTVPRGFVDAVRNAISGSTKFSEFITQADETYRTKGRATSAFDYPLVPSKGLPQQARAAAKKILAPENEKTRNVDFKWIRLPAGTVFNVNKERARIELNDLYRRSILAGTRQSKNDAPIFKGLLFILLSEYFDHQQLTQARREFIENCNTFLLHCIDAEND